MNHLKTPFAFVNSCFLFRAPFIIRSSMGSQSPQQSLRPTRRRSKRQRTTLSPSPASPSPANSDSDFQPTSPAPSLPDSEVDASFSPSPAPSLPDSGEDESFSPSPKRKRRPARRKSVQVSTSDTLSIPPGPSRRSLTSAETTKLRTALLDWYVDNYRTLPWRSPPLYRKGGFPPFPRSIPPMPSSPGSPYAVWVSEVMSQQTRLSVVEGYFKRWMAAFPNVRALADAPLDQVNELWAGLGYYRRARFLHEGAAQVVQEYDGKLPEDVAKLLKIKGVGRYTAGAISSIAFGKNVPLVDGNVERVLSRLCSGLTAPPSDGEEKVALPAAYWKLAETLVKDVECPGDLNQALMEFGATVCKPKAVLCGQCSIQEICGAFQEAVQLGVQDPAQYVTKYPIKDPKKATKVRDETVSVLVACAQTANDCKFLVLQRPGNGLLAGLWEAPNVVLDSKVEAKKADDVEKLHLLLQETLKQSSKQKAKTMKSSRERPALHVEVGMVTHNFSHIRQTLEVELTILRPQESETVLKNGTTSEGIPFRWLSEDELKSAAVSTQMKKVFAAAVKKLPRANQIRR